MKKQAGFTLIELVIVIVILGILAATALPKFVDLSTDAQDAALKGVAGGLSGANSINYGARSANAAKGTKVANCSDGSKLLEGGLATGYTITAAAITAGATVRCDVVQARGAANVTTSFYLTGIN